VNAFCFECTKASMGQLLSCCAECFGREDGYEVVDLDNDSPSIFSPLKRGTSGCSGERIQLQTFVSSPVYGSQTQ